MHLALTAEGEKHGHLRSQSPLLHHQDPPAHWLHAVPILYGFCSLTLPLPKQNTLQQLITI